MCIYIYIFIHMYMYVYVYIYIYIERERDRYVLFNHSIWKHGLGPGMLGPSQCASGTIL